MNIVVIADTIIELAGNGFCPCVAAIGSAIILYLAVYILSALGSPCPRIIMGMQGVYSMPPP